MSREERDAKLRSLGISQETLDAIRTKAPRDRILAGARVALTIDDEPNSDLIEYIAGYAPRSAIYHYFRSMKELRNCVQHQQVRNLPPQTRVEQTHLDLVTVIPQQIGGYAVHMENMGGGKQVSVWQKVNGGMRSVVLNRSVLRRDFLAGVLLYAGEGTKSLQSARVELANSNPSILRLHVKFMEALGFPIGKLKARFQIHSPEEALEAKNLWMGELGLKASQFVKPMMRASTGKTRRRTFTLQLTYANMMLLHLLRHWTDTLEDLIRSMNL